MTWFAAMVARWAAGAYCSPPPDDATDDEAFGEFDGPIDIPENRVEAYETFGDPGIGKVDRRWERKTMRVATGLPGSWNSGRGRLYIHRLAEPYLREALRRCAVAGVLDEIERLGCFNFRHQRHDPSRPLSYHAFGVAVDLNSSENAAKRFSPGTAPKPFSVGWAELYPDGLSERLVRCFESTGWMWGGRWKTFVDPMHFQLVG